MDLEPRERPFRPDTGVGSYDAVTFSQQPVTRRMGALRGGGVTVVRFEGVQGQGRATSWLDGSLSDGDRIVVSTRARGRFLSRIDDFRIDRELVGGEGMMIPYGADALSEFDGGNISVRICFEPGLLARMSPKGARTEQIPQVLEDPLLVAIAHTLEREAATPGFAAELLIDSAIRAAAVLLARNTDRAPADRRTQLHLAPVRLKRVTDFVEANLGTEVGVEQLAAVAGLSPFHFSRVFRLATGESPYQFVRARRLAHARDLLEGTAMPLAEVALACGFANQSHFTAAFTEATGLSPGRHRRQYGRAAARHVRGFAAPALSRPLD